MLSERYREEYIKQALFPTADLDTVLQLGNRERWGTLPKEIKDYYINKGTHKLAYAWPSLPAILFMDYRRTGNRLEYERLSIARRHALVDLVIAECIEHQGRFLDDILNGIWCICEESFWGFPAHNEQILPDIGRPTIDLFAGETSSVLAWTAYLLKDSLIEVSPLIIQRIRDEIESRIMGPFLRRDDYSWMGFQVSNVNNWNPWCNWNCLTAFILIEDDIERRSEAVVKALRSLDVYMNCVPEDGGCDEGPGYWGYSGGALFECLDLLYCASAGRIDFFDTPLIHRIGQYIYRAHIAGNYYVNFADGAAKLDGSAHWSVNPSLVYRYGIRIGDRKLQNLGVEALRGRGPEAFENKRSSSPYRIVPGIFLYKEMTELAEINPNHYERDIWFPDTEFMAAREHAGTSEGFYVAAKGGHNNERHNHNDIGNFIVYHHGHPIVIDVGVEMYTAKTFSPERYDIWTMQSDYHNVPLIAGYSQKAGTIYRAGMVQYEANKEKAMFQLDLSKAYPKEAGVVRWTRRIELGRGKEQRVTVSDDFCLETIGEGTRLHLMLAVEPRVLEEGRIALGQEVVVCYNPDCLAATIETVHITDEARLKPVWGDAIYRLVMCAVKPLSEGTWCLHFESN
ncbi:heparinase II/III domain-containing protein [Paenibacillus sp. FSL H8-0034]|uniref:heparinase II/III domain-containing protein n=1 Tax=Paenibacillus sp. FSL H8-0034 TaxID=2954671 RepID=UPI0030F817BE